MEKGRIFFVGFLLLLAFLAGIMLSKGGVIFTGNVISSDLQKNYSWTKAICSEDNECLDVIVSCEDGKVADIRPVSGIIQHPLNWTDPRGNGTRIFCD